MLITIAVARITLLPLNKAIEITKDFCDTCIKNKLIRIVWYKAMIPVIQKLEKIYPNFWSLHNILYISNKSYIGLILDKYMQILWLLLLRNKNKIFDTFK